MAAKKKTTIAEILLASDIAELCERLSSTGHDKNVIIIALNEEGGLRIVSNFLDYYKSFGMLHAASSAVFDGIMGENNDMRGEEP